MATAAPPTVEGVTAEENSHKEITLKDCRQDNFLSVINRRRYIYPMWRITRKINPAPIHNNDSASH